MSTYKRGDWVIYHGSMTAHHGPARIVGPLGHLWTVEDVHGHRLYRVRAQSLTPTTPPRRLPGLPPDPTPEQVCAALLRAGLRP